MSNLALRDALAPALTQWGTRPAVVCEGVTWTFAELADAARRLVTWFDSVGVGPGTPVALMLGNGPHFVIADLAIALVGAAKVPLNRFLSDDEALFILKDSLALVCFADERWAPLVEANRAGRARSVRHLVNVDAGGDQSWDRVLGGPAWAGDLRAREIPEDAIGLILYTGGTTGRSKGVVHRQKGLFVNQLTHLVNTDIGPDDRVLLCSPLPHSAGFHLQTALAAGAVSYLEEKFDVEQLLKLVAAESISFLFLVPTMFYRLLEAAAGSTADLSSIRTILYGAAPMSAARLRAGIERFGEVFVQLYGQSEAPNFITRLAKSQHRQPAGMNGSCGTPVGGVEVRIVDPQTGRTCAPGEAGEILARTPYTMSEYLNLPEVTGATLAGGWLHTGDVGYLDQDHFLYVVDRLKDMVISGGMNVYTTAVEGVLLECAGVRGAAVIGVPDDDWGEKVVAFLVADPDTYDEAAVAQHCRDRLSAYMRPKSLVVTPDLPLTAYGKVNKKELVRRFTESRPQPVSPTFLDS